MGEHRGRPTGGFDEGRFGEGNLILHCICVQLCTVPERVDGQTSHKSSYNRDSASTSMPSSGMTTRRLFVFLKGCEILGAEEGMRANNFNIE